MRYLSGFSGIEAASVAWHPLGWTPVAFIENDPFASAVLAHRFPAVPNLGDITKVNEAAVRSLGQVDLFVFGWPCQDHSVAGKRAGLAGKRSGLFYEATRVLRLLQQYAGCRWFVAENVPGLMSSDGGRDFSEVIREFTGLDVSVPEKGWRNSGVAANNDPAGWSVSWRCLDAQYVRVGGFERAVPQRRRRVFLVGRVGSWAGPCQVLLDPDCVHGDTPPRRQAGQGVAASLTGSPGRRCGVPDGGGTEGRLIACGSHEVAGTLDSRTTAGGFPCSDGACSGHVVAFGGNNPRPIDVSTSINAKGGIGRLDFESETFVAYQCHGSNVGPMGTIRSGNGGITGGIPFIPVAYGISSDALDRSGEGDGSAGERAGLGIVEGVSTTVRARPNNAVAYGVSELVPFNPGRPANDVSIPESIGFYHTGGGQGVCEGEGVTPPVKVGSRSATSSLGVAIPVPFNVQAAFSEGNGPHAQPAGVSKCVDSHGLNPDCQQGGTVVMQPQTDFDDEPLSFDWQKGNDKTNTRPSTMNVSVNVAQTLGTTRVPALAWRWAVRRLMPVECEKLQGFPPDWTLVPYRGKPAADGPRYKGIGNSFAVNCVRWIGQRLDMVEKAVGQP